MDGPGTSIGEISVHGDSRDWYLLLCLGGLQAVVKEEVKHHLEASRQEGEIYVFEEDYGGAPDQVEGVHSGQAGCGKLLVATDTPPEILRSLRCVQGLFALVAHSASLDITRSPRPAAGSTPISTPQQTASRAAPAEDQNTTEAALARLESLVTDSPLWPAAVNVWKRFKVSQARSTKAAAADAGGVSGTEQRECPALDQSGQEEEDASRPVGDIDVASLKFRASVVRDGQHPFSSVEASPRLGGAVWSVNRGWTVDLKGYDVEVVAFIVERGVAVGLALDGDRTKRCSHGRIPKEDKGFIETGKRMSSLRPSTAYLMLRMAEPVVGDVIVDCMCGVGTIPFLGAGWFPGVYLVGGEVDDSAIEHVRRNAQSLRRSPAGRAGAAGSACAWDAQALPLRDGSVDAMVVDMPFGQSCGTPRQNARLYPLVMAEIARVLRPSGRAVLLVTQPHLLGVPGLRRDNQKDRKKLRKMVKQARRVGDGGGGDHDLGGGIEGRERAARAAPEEIGSGERCEESTSRQAGSSNSTSDGGIGKDSIADTRGHGVESVTKKEDLDPSVSVDRASPAPEKGENDNHAILCDSERSVAAAAPGALWRIRARHVVNVGGLISHLLLLDRTDETPRSPRVDRRHRVVGAKGYCKRHHEGAVS
ncbi:unnamed protein product [Ectocarpus fasciculatus]